MKRTIVCGIVLLSVVAVFSIPTRNGQDRASEVRSAGAHGSFTAKARVQNGKVKFNEAEDVTLTIDGMINKRANLKKVNGGPNNPKLAGRQNEQSAVYADFDNLVVCRKDCGEDGDCDQYCSSVYENKGCFVSGHSAVCSDIDPMAMVDTVRPDVSSIPKHRYESGTNTTTTANRQRRALSPDMDTVGIVRVIFHADDAFMNVFKTMAGNDADGGNVKAIQFFKLVANEMTLSYQTLKEYGLTYTLNGVSHPQDFAIYVAHVELPTILNNNYQNPDWSAKALDSNNVLVDAIYSVRDFIFYNYTDPAYTNAHLFVSGYSMNSRVIGTAFLSTLCDTYYKSRGYHVSINVRYGMMARLLSHELGHNIGGPHDVAQSVDCPEGGFVMSPYIVYPNTTNRDTYYKFSRCSAESIGNYLSGLNYYLDKKCLYNTETTDDTFLDQFCQGFRGTGMTHDEICQSAYGSSSYACSSSYVINGYVTDCLKSIRCFVGTSCSYMNDVPPGTKCTTDGTYGDNICYGAQCVSGLEICPAGSTTQAPTTQAPTTQAPTTQAPTTQAPTTQAPTTEAPTTEAPTTAEPTTAEPTTGAPTPCYCSSGRCCRLSNPCCSGCYVNGRGDCKLL